MKEEVKCAYCKRKWFPKDLIKRQIGYIGIDRVIWENNYYCNNGTCHQHHQMSKE